MQLTTRLAEEFYFEHKGKAFFNGLVEFMTSGPIVAMVLSKTGAIRAWRELMGPTNVFDARLKAPKRYVALVQLCEFTDQR
jgi:nucleoside-diphosphate kinase